MLLHRTRFGPALGALLLCAGLHLACSSVPPVSEPARPVQALTPEGATDWPPTFTWSGVSADSVVRVRIYDEAERQVYGMEARGTSRIAPDELRRMLEPGETYFWRVARVDANGEEAGASELVPFSVR